MIASVNPFRPTLAKKRLIVVAMVTTPKSAGVRSRANRTVPSTWTASPTPEADTVAVAPLDEAVRLVHARLALAGDDRSVRLIARQLAKQYGTRVF